MPRSNAYAKLRTFIRKAVKEEIEKQLRSQDTSFRSSPPETFDLDPRFSTGHYTVDKEPFPHVEQPPENRQSKRRTSNQEANDHPRFVHDPVGLFGPMPPDAERPPEERRSGEWPPGPPENQSDHFNMPPHSEPRRSGRNRTS